MSEDAAPLAKSTLPPMELFPLTADDCRRLLALQLTGQKEPELAASAAAWAVQLQNDGPVWKLAGDRVAEALTQWLATIHALVRVLTARPPVGSRPRFQEWLGHAQSLTSAGPLIDVSAWETILTASPSRDNPLLRAVVARALSDALTAISVPKTTSAALLPLLRADLKFASEIALPPTAASRAEAAEYIFAADDEACWATLQSVATELREAIAKANQLHERLRMSGSAVPPAATSSALPRDLAAALTDFEKLLVLGSGGWPVVRPELLRQQLRLCELLGKSSVRSSDPWSLSDSRLSHWIESLTPASESAAAPLGNADDAQPAATSPPTATSQMSEPPQPHLPRHSLRRLIEQLTATGDERARQFSVRLEPLASPQAGPPAAATAAWSPDESRKLLACLIYLDELTQQEQSGSAWVSAAQHELRRLIDRVGMFVILDAQLVGRSLVEVSKLAVAVGYFPTARVQPGNVGKVRQPGYALRSADGIGEVICPAKVLVARPPASD